MVYLPISRHSLLKKRIDHSGDLPLLGSLRLQAELTVCKQSKAMLNDLKLKRESSVLWRHCREKHDGEIETFKCSVRDVFGQDATLRQITEAVDIRRESASINNKMEWGNSNLPSLVVQ